MIGNGKAVNLVADFNSAITQAQHMWKLRALRGQRDLNAIKVWAGEQNLLPDSKFYRAATKDLSYLRKHLKQVDVLIDRNVVHVNSVPYIQLLRGKNRIFIATEWNEGSKLQLSNLLTSLRKLNPGKQIVVASPYFPAEGTYKSGSYVAFQQKNGSDSFVKTVLHDSDAMLIPLTTEPGSTVQSTLASWSDELQPYYAAASFGKTDEVLVIIAQPKKPPQKGRLFFGKFLFLGSVTYHLRTNADKYICPHRIGKFRCHRVHKGILRPTGNIRRRQQTADVGGQKAPFVIR